MESRKFIAAAGLLMLAIKDTASTDGIIAPSETQDKVSENQRELNNLFSGLQNPTLPSAFKLRDLALEYGYTVPQRALDMLRPAENWSA